VAVGQIGPGGEDDGVRRVEDLFGVVLEPLAEVVRQLLLTFRCGDDVEVVRLDVTCLLVASVGVVPIVGVRSGLVLTAAIARLVRKGPVVAVTPERYDYGICCQLGALAAVGEPE
jgi:hypothetical protein